jgi:hypothetical protein
MSSKPDVETVVLLAVPAGSNIGVDVSAAGFQVNRGSQAERRGEGRILLKDGSVVPLSSALTHETSTLAADTEHAPVLLKKTKISGIFHLVVAVRVVSLHVLRLEHGDSKVKGVTTGAEDGLLAGAKARDGIVAAVILLGCGGTDVGGESDDCGGKRLGEIHFDAFFVRLVSLLGSL